MSKIPQGSPSPRLRGSRAPVSHSKSKEPRSAQDRAAHIYHTTIIASFTFNFKIFFIFSLIELPAKLFGNLQNSRVGTFRLQQEVFVVAAGPVHHFQPAGQNPLRFVPGSQALPATTQIREDASTGGQKES